MESIGWKTHPHTTKNMVRPRFKVLEPSLVKGFIWYIPHMFNEYGLNVIHLHIVYPYSLFCGQWWVHDKPMFFCQVTCDNMGCSHACHPTISTTGIFYKWDIVNIYRWGSTMGIFSTQFWALLLLLRGKMDVPVGGLLLLSYPLEMHSPVIRQKFTPFVGLENNMFETINQVYPLVI